VYLKKSTYSTLKKIPGETHRYHRCSLPIWSTFIFGHNRGLKPHEICQHRANITDKLQLFHITTGLLAL